jgi:hypothetical protein
LLTWGRLSALDIFGAVELRVCEFRVVIVFHRHIKMFCCNINAIACKLF